MKLAHWTLNQTTLVSKIMKNNIAAHLTKEKISIVLLEKTSVNAFFYINCYIVTLLLKVWIWYGCQNRIENYYHHVGEQLGFYKINKRNDKRFNNRGYSLFILMGIFLKHLWLIPNILKWQDCKIFTKLVPSQTPSRSSHRSDSVKKVFLKICEISQENIFVWVSFVKKRLQHMYFPVKFCKFLRTSANDCFCPS